MGCGHFIARARKLGDEHQYSSHSYVQKDKFSKLSNSNTIVYISKFSLRWKIIKGIKILNLAVDMVSENKREEKQ